MGWQLFVGWVGGACGWTSSTTSCTAAGRRSQSRQLGSLSMLAPMTWVTSLRNLCSRGLNKFLPSPVNYYLIRLFTGPRFYPRSRIPRLTSKIRSSGPGELLTARWAIFSQGAGGVNCPPTNCVVAARILFARWGAPCRCRFAIPYIQLPYGANSVLRGGLISLNNASIHTPP